MAGSRPRRLDVCVLAALALWALDTRALAYVDPGSGGLQWQAVIAAVIGTVFYFRRPLGRFFSRTRRQDPPADNG